MQWNWMRGRSTRLLGWRLIASAAEEYRSDFGASLKPPPAVTSFRYKSSGKPRPKKNQKPAATAKGVSTQPKAIVKSNPKTTGLQKRLAYGAAETGPGQSEWRVHEEPRRQDLRDRRCHSTLDAGVVRECYCYRRESS
jgi:hypothetical protein